MHHEVLTSRMRPVADALRGFPRMVRDVARQLGKSVEFRIAGETTGVDRDILDKLEAPLNHLIRNALDHAIESAQERVAAGKRPVGTIRLEARHRAGLLQITVSDDGRGIDLSHLRRAKVVARPGHFDAARPVERGGAARVPVPARVLDPRLRHRDVGAGSRARRRANDGPRSRRCRSGRNSIRPGDSVSAPVADHSVGDPGLARRYRRRALRTAPEPD